MDDSRVRPQTAALGEELDRPEAVLGETLFDLARLLVGMDVQRQAIVRGVPTELGEPVPRARPHGVGGDADADARRAELLEALQILGDRRLPEAVDAAPRVGDVEDDELDPDLACGLGGGAGLVEAEVVELADRGVAGAALLL